MSMLGPLLASLVQFSQGSGFGHLELAGGIQVIMSTDPVAQVVAAVVFEGDESELARLKSLVVLRQVVSRFRDGIERLASAHAAHTQLMADAYTLSQALEGMVGDGEDANETKSEFFEFEQAFVAPTMKRSLADCCSLLLQVMTGQTAIIRASMINAERGAVVCSANSFEGTQDYQHWRRVFDSLHTQRTIESAALTLHASFPLLYQSSLLRHGGFSSFRVSNNSSSSNTMTLIVHVATKDTMTAYLGLQMLPVSALFREYLRVCT